MEAHHSPLASLQAAELPSDPAPQTIMQLLTELVQKNRELCKRQGNSYMCYYTRVASAVYTGVLEEQLETSGKQYAELTREVGTLKQCVEQSMHTTNTASHSE